MPDEFGIMNADEFNTFLEDPQTPSPGGDGVSGPGSGGEGASAGTDSPTPETDRTAQPGDANDQPGPSERARDPLTGRFVAQEPAAQPLAESRPENAGPTEETPVEPRVYAGKYNDVDQLEKGYRELRDLQRRTAERANAYEQRIQEVEFQARQMEQALQQAIPLIRQAQAQARPQPQPQPQVQYDELGNPVQVAQPQPTPTLTPDMVQPMVESLVNERMALQAQAMQQQQWQAQQYAEAEAAITGFYEKHPDVERNGSADEDIASTILALNEAWASNNGGTIDISSPEALEIAYEASRRPALQSVLAKFPQLFDDDEGMAQARLLASQIDGNPGTSTQPVGRMTPRPNTPVVERGSSPAPAQQTPLDEFEAAVADFRNANKARGSSVFFGE